MALPAYACNYYTRADVNGSGKHSSLLRYDEKYRRKQIYSTGPEYSSLFIQNVNKNTSSVLYETVRENKGATALIIMTFRITTFNIMTFSIMTPSIKGLYVTLIITDTQRSNDLHYAECHYDECRYAECLGGRARGFFNI
jgi:hypothetical protein